MPHPALVTVALLGLSIPCLAQWSRLMHPTPGAIRVAGIWLNFGLLFLVGAAIVAADGLGFDWFRNQPAWLAFIYVAAQSVLVWAYVDGQVSTAPPPPAGGVGGKGGDATVGGSGIAIGGPAGHAGRYGRGGDGGSAHVAGDGLAAGGEAGSVGDDGVWRPPARSGYEVARRALGLPIDPYIAQFGRGGAMPGWEERKAVVDGLRHQYFADHPGDANDISAVPTEWINARLAAQGLDWRARVLDERYEFFLPGR